MRSIDSILLNSTATRPAGRDNPMAPFLCGISSLSASRSGFVHDSVMADFHDEVEAKFVELWWHLLGLGYFALLSSTMSVSTKVGGGHGDEGHAGQTEICVEPGQGLYELTSGRLGARGATFATRSHVSKLIRLVGHLFEHMVVQKYGFSGGDMRVTVSWTVSLQGRPTSGSTSESMSVYSVMPDPGNLDCMDSSSKYARSLFTPGPGHEDKDEFMVDAKQAMHVVQERECVYSLHSHSP